MQFWIEKYYESVSLEIINLVIEKLGIFKNDIHVYLELENLELQTGALNVVLFHLST